MQVVGFQVQWTKTFETNKMLLWFRGSLVQPWFFDLLGVVDQVS